MSTEPSESVAARPETAEKSRTSRLAFVIGAATVLWAVIAAIRLIIPSAKTETALLPAVLGASIPWAAAGAALMVRSFRGALRWPRGVATWAGAFLVGAIVMIIGASISGGGGDSTLWVMNTIAIIVFLVVGTLLLRVGFKR